MVTLVLGGLFIAFRAVTSPFLEVEHEQRKFSSHDHSTNVSMEVVAEAKKWFPDYSWVAESKKHFHDGGRYLYCRDFGLTDNDKTVTVKPIAMILHSEAGDRPVTIVADSATLESSTPISPNATEFGRITGGVLAGNVRIEGPRGLRIEGRSLRLDEEALKLWSTDPIQFQMDEHTGVAKAGVDIYLQTPPGSEDGLSNVTDVKQIRLNGRVTCEFFLPADHVNEEDQELRVNAAGGFSYEVMTRTGVFSGLQPGKGERRLKTLSNEVLVTRILAGKVTDQLVCPELMLRFRNTLPSEAKASPGQRMQLEHIKAWGRQVLYKSRTHDVTVNANEFSYAVGEQRVDIYRTNNGSTPQSPNIEVAQGKNTLRVPHIRVLHTPKGGIQRVELNGRGVISGTHGEETKTANNAKPAESADPPVALSVTWLKSLTMQMGADQLSRIVTLTGGASVSEPSRDFQLMANTIKMKLIGAAETRNKSAKNGTQGISRVSHTNKPKDESADTFDVGSLRPRLITAAGNVVLNSPKGSGQLREKLTVKFEDMLAANPVKTVSTADGKETQKDDEPEEENQDRISFESDSLEAVVGVSVDPDNRQVEFRNIWLNGDVEIIQQSDDANRNFAASGNQLYATGSQPSDLKINLFGDPAKFSSDTRNVEGPRIDLSAIDSEAKVVGNGRIRFLIEKGFDGRKLLKPTPLEIYWSDHMVFQKRSAHFVGNIRVVMDDGETQDVEITCAGMTVHFSKDLVLGKTDDRQKFDAVPAEKDTDGSTAEASGIESIECHNTVKVQVNQWLAGEPVGRHAAEFADLDLNLVTGDFSAIGQGYLESVSPDEDGRLQGSAPAIARANTPSQTSETAFVYLKVEFIGDLTGNLHRKEANLTHNVMALVAPARRIDDEINLDVPASELPEKAGILLAEMLTISAIGNGDESPASFAIVARDNARLRSRSLSATGADVITYDHQKEQFIMKADGQGAVRVNHQDGRSNKLNSLSGNRFEYYRRTNQLSADGLGGLRLED